MTRPAVRYQATAGVALITLDRPEVRNAITVEAIDAIVDSVSRAAADSEIGALVLTGTDPAFSAGGNVKDMAAGNGLFAGDPDQIAEGYRESIHRIPRALHAIDKPTIAAVNGPAVGAGCDMALMCDMRIASERAAFSEPFVSLGIISGDGGAWFLPRVVGPQRAAAMAFTGRMVKAAEALQWGMVLEVVAHEHLMETVMQLAAEIAAKPPHALRLTKRLLRHSPTMGLDEFLDLTAALQAISHHTADHRKAMDALLDATLDA